VTSQNNCGTIDFKEGFLQKENNVVHEIKSEIQSLKENLAIDDLRNEVQSLKSQLNPAVKVSHRTHDKTDHKSRPRHSSNGEHHLEESFCDPELKHIQNKVMQKIEFLEKRFSEKNTPVKMGAEMGAPHTAIMDKLCNIENQNIQSSQLLKSQVLNKIESLEKQINDRSECKTSNALKTQVMDKINLLESKINSKQSDDVLLKLANLEKRIDVQAECSEHEKDMKQQVFEKLAKLENHFKIKSEIPVVSKAALKDELNKLEKLVQMRQKLA